MSAPAEFIPTEKQLAANELLGGAATHVLLAGGSRSGKTFIIVRRIVRRALFALGSRHGIFRYRFGHVKQSIVHDTFPRVMRLCFPDVAYDLNKSDWFVTLPGGSEIWFGGLDDKERVEKILGNEFATIFLNECSQIPYNSRNMAITRLAQLVFDADGNPLPLRMYYDENPPDKGHWTYKLFKLKVDPDSKQALPNPDDYGFMQLNPGDNQANLSADYIKTLEALPARLRKRFLEGQFRDASPNALFTDEMIDRYRLLDGELPQMLRIVIAVDPSGADDEDNQDNDEIGIHVAGLGIDGNGYSLADLTCKAGPAVWGRVAVEAFIREKADRVVGEVNFGGAMVGFVIKTAAAALKVRVPFTALTASRGKSVRAEPVSSLVEEGKWRFAGIFRELEDELTAMTTHGYTGDNSPNRADAMIWAAAALFPQLTKEQEKPKEVVQQQILRRRSDTGWMHNLAVAACVLGALFHL